ncbi:MAG: hypothetical protein ACREQ4_02945 [Candidatus Binataceae bacterium]
MSHLCKIAERIKATTRVTVQIAGFDSGQGMPPPTDYRGHPEQFAPSDFPMDFDALRTRLPANCRLVLGQ